MHLLPSRWYAFDYSTSAWIFFAVLAALACLATLLRLREKPVLLTRALTACSWTTLGIVLLGHALTIWILSVDPQRNATALPLPQPFAFLALPLTTALLAWLPIYLGLVGGALMLARRSRLSPALVAFATLVAAYSVWVKPWIGYIIAD
jgi:hypothetical protein